MSQTTKSTDDNSTASGDRAHPVTNEFSRKEFYGTIIVGWIVLMLTATFGPNFVLASKFDAMNERIDAINHSYSNYSSSIDLTLKAFSETLKNQDKKIENSIEKLDVSSEKLAITVIKAEEVNNTLLARIPSDEKIESLAVEIDKISKSIVSLEKLVSNPNYNPYVGFIASIEYYPVIINSIEELEGMKVKIPRIWEANGSYAHYEAKLRAGEDVILWVKQANGISELNEWPNLNDIKLNCDEEGKNCDIVVK